MIIVIAGHSPTETGVQQARAEGRRRKRAGLPTTFAHGGLMVSAGGDGITVWEDAERPSAAMKRRE
jgi:hypothetical protein